MTDYKQTHQQRHRQKNEGNREKQESRRAPRVVGGNPNFVSSRRGSSEDDAGTVLTCTECRLGFFSRWEAPEGFGSEAPVGVKETLSEKAQRVLLNAVPKKHQVCTACLSNRIFKKNMAILNDN